MHTYIHNLLRFRLREGKNAQLINKQKMKKHLEKICTIS